MKKEYQLTPEFKLALSIINHDSCLQKEGIDWDLFLQVVRHHRIFPSVYQEIQKQELRGVPENVMVCLSQWYKQNVFRMLHLASEMEQINQLFHQEQIRMIQLKGPEMGRFLYGDLSLRTSGDLDILVSIKDLEQAEKMLTSEGYEKDDYIETVLGDWKWRHHHVAYLHPMKKIKVELHWRLNPGPGKEPGFKSLWTRRQSLSPHAHLLGKEDYLFFLMHHGARHGWSRLRWLLDIRQFIGREPDWKKMSSREYSCYSGSIAGQALTLVERLFKTELPQAANQFLKDPRAEKLADETMFYLERMVNLHDLPLEKKISEYHRKHLYSLMSPSQRLFFAASTLYPYPEDAHTLPLPKSLHVLYFPLRPALWVWRKSKGPMASEEVKT